ncbi:peroxiredoxin family protein [Algoriphagus hitonicola]|uniref:Thioredoxin-like n=1 Tax=Algoriphagus hitonicola TaxID=435880 RepID=A0A1I2W0W0_9BACT|nr:TlpA disulfide reductase family protein [Algoriphagus hitonicola]SFG95020.1 Thioredoxin-like [Algoriphagus hitonicola]
MKKKYLYSLVFVLASLFFMGCADDVKVKLDEGGPQFIGDAVVTGNLSQLASQSIRLEGFNGLKTYPISNVTIDDKGNFKLTYSNADYGVGYLMSTDEKPLFVILNGEDIEIVGEVLSHTETIKITKGKENQWFEQYAQEHPRREQALSAWIYLEKIYTLDSLFAVQEQPVKNIQAEKQRIKSEDAAFLAKLPKGTYVSWFLPTRKLVSSVSTVAQYRPEEIPTTIAAFRALDYTDQRLYKSGLFKEAIESHFWLLENSGHSLDSSFIEMQHSIDAMMVNLVNDEQKLNEITNYLFDLLERHSLFQASEYLALKVLNETSSTIDSDLAKKLESYRAMKKGNTAPDIIFEGDYYAPGYEPNNSPNKLSDLKSKYTVVVFGASWCPQCTEELPEIAKQYPKWKANDVEVVLVSLDEDQTQFDIFAKTFPFISFCDYQKWNSTAVKDYYVFGTPTMFLLNDKREILLRPSSLKQMDGWVDWYLVQGKN